jgi:hemerythrin-like domain-containing protein
MTDTIELLFRQHREALERLAEVEAGLTTRTADLGAFVRYVENDLAVHFALEEEALFPLLRRYPELARGPVAVMESEHVEFRAMVRHLAETLDAARPAEAEAGATAIVDFLRAHIAKEDHVLLPLALHTLTPAERDEVNERARVILAAGDVRLGDRTHVA